MNLQSPTADANARPRSVLRTRRTFSPGMQGRYPGEESSLALSGTRNPVVMTLCWCPPGGDLMEGFWIAKHPVSQRQWTAVMGNNPSKKSKGDDFPVDSVSWNDAMEFCKKTDLRLPSEKEWEHACRAGTTTAFALGEGTVINSQLANHDGNRPDGSGPMVFEWLYRNKTTPEGSFPPNAWGLHDMHGQLWEWCADEAFGGRALRGGSWSYYGRDATSRERYGREPGVRGDRIGFRPCPSSISYEASSSEKK